MWIKKCNKYFTLCKIEKDQKIDLASLNIIEKEEKWMSSYLTFRRNVDWSDFMVDLSARFKDEVGCNGAAKNWFY